MNRLVNVFEIYRRITDQIRNANSLINNVSMNIIRIQSSIVNNYVRIYCTYVCSYLWNNRIASVQKI